MTTRERPLHHPPHMTVPEAARYLGVGKKIVYQLIEFDELEAVRMDGGIRIDTGSLDAFRASGKQM